MSMAPNPKHSGILSSQWERLGATATSHLARGLSMLVYPLRVLPPDTSGQGPAPRTSKRISAFLIPQNQRQSQALVSPGINS